MQESSWKATPKPIVSAREDLRESRGIDERESTTPQTQPKTPPRREKLSDVWSNCKERSKKKINKQNIVVEEWTPRGVGDEVWVLSLALLTHIPTM